MRCALITILTDAEPPFRIVIVCQTGARLCLWPLQHVASLQLLWMPIMLASTDQADFYVSFHHKKPLQSLSDKHHYIFKLHLLQLQGMFSHWGSFGNLLVLSFLFIYFFNHLALKHPVQAMLFMLIVILLTNDCCITASLWGCKLFCQSSQIH